MNKTGNNHSSLLSQLAAAAAAAAPRTAVFEDSIIKIASTKPMSFQDVMKQAQEMGLGPMGDDGMGGEVPPPADETPGLPEEGGHTEDIEGAKSSLVNALIALCGGPEEAKACIDASSSPVSETDGLPSEGSSLGELDNMSSPEASPMEMPAPMQM